INYISKAFSNKFTPNYMLEYFINNKNSNFKELCNLHIEKQCEFSNLQIVRKILKSGKFDSNKLSRSFQLAIEKGHYFIVSELLKNRNFNHLDNFLEYSIFQKHYFIVQK